MAALIIVGVVRTWDWSDPRNSNNNAVFDFYSVQELVRGIQAGQLLEFSLPSECRWRSPYLNYSTI